MGKIDYFFSGRCYKKGTQQLVAHFDLIINQDYELHPDPNSARKAAQAAQVKMCADAGYPDAFIHIEQMNTL